MTNRETRQEKLLALMVNDLGVADLDEKEMTLMIEEVNSLSDADLENALTERLGLTDPGSLDEALAGVRNPERLSSGFTGAPDMSHEPRPEERP